MRRSVPVCGPQDRFSWITPSLLLGAQPSAADLRDLRRIGIGAVLSIRDDDPNPPHLFRRLNLAYHQIPIASFSSPSLSQLAEACAFIDQQQQSGRSVLVHCALGMQRSAGVCLAHLIHKGRPFGVALELLQTHRACARPNAEQLATIVAFAQRAEAPT